MSSVGIVVALAAEARTLVAKTVEPGHMIALDDGAGLWLSGMGPDAARRAAESLADAGAAALAVFGVAGALAPLLGNGTLFCPERVLNEHGDRYMADAAWRTRLQQALAANTMPLHTEGSLLSVSSPLLDGSAKANAHHRYGALAVDMESTAVATVAQDRGIPFITLRAIVDEAGDTIPDALNGSIDAWGRPRTMQLITALCRRPTLLAALPRLYSRMQRATHALRAAAETTGPTLGWHR